MNLVVLELQLLDVTGAPIDGASFSVTPLASGTVNGPAVVASPINGVTDSLGRLESNYGGAIAVAYSDDFGTSQVAYEFKATVPGVGLITATQVITLESTPTATDTAALLGEDGLTLSLTQLLVSEAMIGSAITGGELEDGTTISAVDTLTNTLTLSQESTPGTLTVHIANAFDLGTILTV